MDGNNNIVDADRINLLTINTDCVLEIFKNLECIDLGSVADVPRLKEAAEMVFVSKWKRNVTFNHNAIQKAQDFLFHFGSHIQSIRLVSFDSCEFALVRGISYSLFFDLQKLVLENCAVSLGMLTTCKELVELSLIRVEEFGDDIQYQHLKLNKLKSLKIEMHPGIRCPHRHCNMNATHLEFLGHKMHREERTARVHGLQFIAEAQNLECLEIDVLPQDLIVPTIESIPKFQNIKTLKIYCEYLTQHPDTLNIVGKLEHLTEFVWGYPKKFDAHNLRYVIKNAPNLQQMVVSFSRRPIVCERVLRHMNVQLYEEMLNIVSQRSNEKPLSLIVVGHRYETQLKQFDATFPMHAKLKITCLRSRDIEPILNINIKSTNSRIKMTNKQINLLRDCGMLS